MTYLLKMLKKWILGTVVYEKKSISDSRSVKTFHAKD